MNRLSIVSVFVLNFVLINTAFAIKLSSQLKNEIQQVAATIQQMCPPAECVVIGVGRSPTPIIAALQESPNSSYARSIPLSNFRYNTWGSKGIFRDLSNEQKKVLHGHFDKYLPSLSEIAGRRILLVDYASSDYGGSGQSVIAANKAISEYYKTMTPTPPSINAAPLCQDSVAMNIANSFHSNHLQYPTTIALNTPSILWNELNRQIFDDYSQYGSYDISKPKEITVNPKYNELFNELHPSRIPHDSHPIAKPAREQSPPNTPRTPSSEVVSLSSEFQWNLKSKQLELLSYSTYPPSWRPYKIGEEKSWTRHAMFNNRLKEFDQLKLNDIIQFETNNVIGRYFSLEKNFRINLQTNQIERFSLTSQQWFPFQESDTAQWIKNSHTDDMFRQLNEIKKLPFFSEIVAKAGLPPKESCVQPASNPLPNELQPNIKVTPLDEYRGIKDIWDIKAHVDQLLNSGVPAEEIAAIFDVDGTLTNYSEPHEFERNFPGRKAEARANAQALIKELNKKGIKLIASSAHPNFKGTVKKICDLGLEVEFEVQDSCRKTSPKCEDTSVKTYTGKELAKICRLGNVISAGRTTEPGYYSKALTPMVAMGKNAHSLKHVLFIDDNEGYRQRFKNDVGHYNVFGSNLEGFHVFGLTPVSGNAVP